MVFNEREVFVGIGIFIIIAGLVAVLMTLNSSDNNMSLIQESESKDTEGIFNKIGRGITGNVVNLVTGEENYCGDGYCYIDGNGDYENCENCQQDCGECKKIDKCGNKICDVGECSNCFSDCSLIQCENGVCEKNKGENCVSAPNDCKCNKDYVCNLNTKECDYSSGTVQKEEEVITIEDESQNQNYPIIFIHGHSTYNEETLGGSLNTFKLIESKIIVDGIAKKGETVYPNDNLKKDMYSNKGKPVTFITTYYSDITSLSNVHIEEEDIESISAYGYRLTDVIKEIKRATGKNKVNIVAHSMGGLVAREHIRQTDGIYVNKLIMIGTPNHGIYGLIIRGFCDKGHEGKECEDMQPNSDFMKGLEGHKVPDDVIYYTIAGSCEKIGQDPHDNVIMLSSVQLNSAKENYVVKCDNQNDYTLLDSFHNAMLNPDEVPEVYNKVVEFLRE